MAAQTLPDIPPHRASKGHSVRFKLLEAEFGDGYEQAAIDGINNKREIWNLTWSREDGADIVTLKAFFDSLNGVDPFFWTPVNEVVPKLWRVRGYDSKPEASNVETLSLTFKRWFGEEPV